MINLKDKRILLIGGAGFIGHNLALALKKKGAIVQIVDSLQVNNLLSFAYSNYEEVNRDLYHTMVNERFDLLREANIPIEIQDARDYHAMARLFNQIKPQIVIQLAAVAHANKSNKDPYSTFDHSLRTLENALDCSKGRVEHFVYFSSSMVYGHFESGVVTEDTVCNPLGIYGALKYSGEKIVIAYNQAFDLPYTIIRPSALYGERCVSRRVGQIFIESAIKGETITVHGDGGDSLDFTYIQDLVHGVAKVLENEKSKSEIFNLTFGESRTIKQMADIIESHFPGINVKYIPKDKLTPDRGALCVDKARELIGYDPQNPLEVGFVKYIEWYKEQFNWKSPSLETV